MAEGGGLLNRYTLQRRIEGSNPSGSASLSLEIIKTLDFQAYLAPLPRWSARLMLADATRSNRLERRTRKSRWIRPLGGAALPNTAADRDKVDWQNA